jgi:ATP-dependent 26S proteasome regulatory subunit
MFEINLKELKLGSNIGWEKVIELTKGCSGADICNICRDAAYMPMRRKLQQIGGITKITELSQSDLLNEVISEADLI